MDPTRLHSPRRLLAVTALGSLLLAACGSGGNDDAAPAAAAAAPATVAPATAAPAAPAAASTEAAGESANSSEAFAQAFVGATSLDGEAFDGGSLAGTDAVLWFWAPWCTICRGEAPEVADVAARYADRVTLIGVPGRGELDAMQEFVDDTGTDGIRHVADLDGGIWSRFGVYGQPAYAFIDDSGSVEVVVGGLGGDALAERIDALLAA